MQNEWKLVEQVDFSVPNSVESEVNNITRSFEDEVHQVVANGKRQPIKSHSHTLRFPENKILAVPLHNNSGTANGVEGSCKMEINDDQKSSPLMNLEVKKIRKSLEDVNNGVGRVNISSLDTARSRHCLLGMNPTMLNSFDKTSCGLRAAQTSNDSKKSIEKVKKSPSPRSIQSEPRKLFQDEAEKNVENFNKRAYIDLDSKQRQFFSSKTNTVAVNPFTSSQVENTTMRNLENDERVKENEWKVNNDIRLFDRSKEKGRINVDDLPFVCAPLIKFPIAGRNNEPEFS